MRGLLPLALVGLLSACGAAPEEHPAGISGEETAIESTSVDRCTLGPAEGCPCNEEGAKGKCTSKRTTASGYVTCAPGEIICTADLVWGACVGPSVWPGN